MLNKNQIGENRTKDTGNKNCGVHQNKTSASTTMTENAGQARPTAQNPAWALPSSRTFAASLFTVWHGASALINSEVMGWSPGDLIRHFN